MDEAGGMARRPLLLAAPLWAALGVPAAAAGQRVQGATSQDGPPAQPFLRVEAGAHTAPVTRLAVDEAGRLLATVSGDKTLRLWSLPDGAPRGVLRPPIGPREEGELYADIPRMPGAVRGRVHPLGPVWQSNSGAGAAAGGRLGGSPARRGWTSSSSSHPGAALPSFPARPPRTALRGHGDGGRALSPDGAALFFYHSICCDAQTTLCHRRSKDHAFCNYDMII